MLRTAGQYCRVIVLNAHGQKGGYMANEKPSIAFARAMRARREQLGWSQEKLADRLAKAGHPLDRATVARIENPRSGRRLLLDEAMAIDAALMPTTVTRFLALDAGTAISDFSGIPISDFNPNPEPAPAALVWAQGHSVADLNAGRIRLLEAFPLSYAIGENLGDQVAHVAKEATSSSLSGEADSIARTVAEGWVRGVFEAAGIRFGGREEE